MEWSDPYSQLPLSGHIQNEQTNSSTNPDPWAETQINKNIPGFYYLSTLPLMNVFLFHLLDPKLENLYDIELDDEPIPDITPQAFFPRTGDLFAKCAIAAAPPMTTQPSHTQKREYIIISDSDDDVDDESFDDPDLYDDADEDLPILTKQHRRMIFIPNEADEAELYDDADEDLPTLTKQYRRMICIPKKVEEIDLYS